MLPWASPFINLYMNICVHKRRYVYICVYMYYIWWQWLPCMKLQPPHSQNWSSSTFQESKLTLSTPDRLKSSVPVLIVSLSISASSLLPSGSSFPSPPVSYPLGLEHLCSQCAVQLSSGEIYLQCCWGVNNTANWIYAFHTFLKMWKNRPEAF